MPAVVIEDTLPILYESWPAWRRTKIHEARRRRLPLVEPGTAPCARCWGQGRIWEPAPNGEGLVPRPCLACLGRGRMPSG